MARRKVRIPVLEKVKLENILARGAYFCTAGLRYNPSVRVLGRDIPFLSYIFTSNLILNTLVLFGRARVSGISKVGELYKIVTYWKKPEKIVEKLERRGLLIRRGDVVKSSITFNDLTDFLRSAVSYTHLTLPTILLV